VEDTRVDAGNLKPQVVILGPRRHALVMVKLIRGLRFPGRVRYA
jgi:hypothetical protein